MQQSEVTFLLKMLYRFSVKVKKFSHAQKYTHWRLSWNITYSISYL